MPLVRSSGAYLIGMKVFCMINGLGRWGALGHGIWVGVKDKVVGVMELLHSHCEKVCGRVTVF